jgi:hypothetical protein
MNRTLRTAGLAALAAMGSLASAQNGWLFECIDPTLEEPYSQDYGFDALANDLIYAAIGLSGTVTYGGENGPCYAPTARTLEAAGRFAFRIGAVGTVQSNIDDLMALTVGAPQDPVGDYCFAKILKNGQTDAESVLFGPQGIRVHYQGASKRYMVTIWGDADVEANLEMKVIGNACRMRWRLRNLQATSQDLGLLYGAYVGYRLGPNRTDSTGTNQANSLLGTLSGIPKNFDNYIGYTVLDTTRPVRNERRYGKTSPNFPKVVNFFYGQSSPFGMRVDNTPGADTPDANASDLFVIGNHGAFQSPGLLWDNTMRLVVFGDTPANPNPLEEADITLNETSFVQRFPAIPVSPGETREIVHYVRQTWGVSDYADPYAAIVDAPVLIANSPTGLNGLSPNPFRVRAYIDNQYATLDREVTMRNVKFTIFLPEGMRLASGESQQKTLPVIGPNAVSFVEWQVTDDGKSFGSKQIEVRFEPTPGPVKTLTAQVNVAATPKLPIPDGPSLLSVPYTLKDTAFDAVLGLRSGLDYIAYQWEPKSAQYVPANTVRRGVGYWVQSNVDLGLKPLEGALPAIDTATGGLIVSLERGWNLIGNPYPYPVKLAELNLISEENPSDALSWVEAVAGGLVQASLAYWRADDTLPDGGMYEFTEGPDSLLQPHLGYWVFSTSFRPLRIQWPPVFTSGLPGSNRRPDAPDKQTDRNWQLQLSARSREGYDAQNFIAGVRDPKLAQQMRAVKPPAAPQQRLELSILDSKQKDGRAYARAVEERPGRQTWEIQVRAQSAGEVTVTWPNLASVPRGLRFRISDPQTGESKDLRSTSGYTFTMAKPGVKTLTVTVEAGGSPRPVIGNVVVSRPGKAPNGPVALTYALSADAVVTARVLSASGKEVFTITRGRAAQAGDNTVTWNLRDNANRAVAPGTYRVEILAETPGGERVRKIVPVNVVR